MIKFKIILLKFICIPLLLFFMALLVSFYWGFIGISKLYDMVKEKIKELS